LNLEAQSGEQDPAQSLAVPKAARQKVVGNFTVNLVILSQQRTFNGSLYFPAP